MSAPVVQIEKLDEMNYDCWSVQMRSVLIHSGFWRIVNGTTKKEGEAAAVSKWVSDDEKALASIFLSVKSTQLGYIRNCTTSNEAWKKLQEIYMPRGPLQKVTLYKKLINIKMAPNGNIVQHINEFTEVFEKLKEVGSEIQEELLSIMLMSSLPKEYDNFVIAMETRDDLPTFSSLKQKVLEEGKRQRQKVEEEESPHQAFLAKGTGTRSEKRQTKGKKHFKGKCFVCGVAGHFANKCEKRGNSSNNSNKAQAMTMLATAETSAIDSKKWYVDSGATSHMCNNREVFVNFCDHNEKIGLAGDKYIKAVGKGDVIINANEYEITLENVLYSPELQANFISVSKVVDKGLEVKFNERIASIKRPDGDIVLQAARRNNMFVFDNITKEGLFAMKSGDLTWHNRYGHLNFKNLQDLSSKCMVNGMKINGNGEMSCRTCMVSKIHVLPFSHESQTKSKELIELVHSDVCGPFRVCSVGGSKYFVTFIDDKSRRIFIYFMKAKNEVFEKFKIYKAQVERQTGLKIKTLRSDNGREYLNNNFNSFLEREGISRQLTVPHTPQQNGVAERANRTLIEMARSMMVHANITPSLWAEAINTAVYIRNRCPTKLQIKTPYEEWCGRKPSVQHFKTFGSCAVALDKSGGKSKFDAKGDQYTMVGYSTTAKAYRLYDAKRKRIIEHRDVLFDENSFRGQNNGGIEDSTDNDLTVNIDNIQHYLPITDTENSTKDNADSGKQIEEGSDDGMDDFEGFNDIFDTADEGNNSTDTDEAAVQDPPDNPNLNCKRKRGRPRKQQKEVICNAAEDNIPQTVEQASSCQNREEWLKAMDCEYRSLCKNKTWSLVDLPSGQRAIPCKWVYAIKKDVNGEVERYKARLVAKGCNQRFGIDFHETFSPVVRYSTIRILLALAVKEKMFLHQIDVSTAYLNSDLPDEVYMQQPPNIRNNKSPDKVLRLHKAIYGLKQSGREWNAKLDATLREIGFVPCENEPCLYKGKRKNKLVLIAVYVDDIIIGCCDNSVVLDIKRKLSTEFEVSDKGQLRHFLGMEIEREGDNGMIKLGQSQYIRDVLKHYGMESCKPLAVPLETGYQINNNDDGEKIDQTQYQSLIGTLMYLAISTRPDILHSVSKMAQRNADPRKNHMVQLKHILRYLKGTIDLKLIYQPEGNQLEGYVDSDWGGNSVDRKSYTGFIFYFGGSPITWESRKQKSVALSSTEAEYMAASEASKEAIYLKRLLAELNASNEDTVTLHIDNQGAQKLAENPVHHKRSKHIDIRFHHIRDLVQNKEVKLEYCPTADMIADVLTKNLAKVKHMKFIDLMNLK